MRRVKMFAVALALAVGASSVVPSAAAFAAPAGATGTHPAQQNQTAGIGTGAVSIKGQSSELVPGVTVEIRKDTCEGAPVWRTTTSDHRDAYGAFGIGLEAGKYCILTLDVPAPYKMPANVTFTMEKRAGNWVTVWLPGPAKKTVVTGAVVAKNANGAPINGVNVHMKEGACADNGRGVWQNTTAANQWAQGGFGISLAVGTYCVTPLAVPKGYNLPAPFEVTLSAPSPAWVTVWVPGPIPKVTVTGAVVAKNSKGVPVNWVRVNLREGSCSENGSAVWEGTTAPNQTAQGGFGISLTEGKYCAKTLIVPEGYDVPAQFEVNLRAPSPAWVTVWIPGPGPWIPEPVQQPVQQSSTFEYKNCADVRAHRKTPILRGEYGFSSRLDRDGDGIGCE